MSKRNPTTTRETLRPIIVRAASLNEETMTVEGVIATQGVVRNAWGEDEILMASGAKLPAQVPLMDSHDRSTISNVLGSVRNLRVQGTDVIGTLHFDQGEKAQQAFGLIRDGHLTDLSVGARVLEEQQIRPGQKKKIGGAFFEAGSRPMRVVTRWEIKETSLVAVGADSASVVRGQHKDEKKMTTQIFEDTTEASAMAERDRILAIQEAGRGLPAEEVQRAITEGVSVTEAKASFLDSVRSSRQPAVPLPRNFSIGYGVQATDDDLSLALATRSGVNLFAGINSSVERDRLEHDLDRASHFERSDIRDIVRHALNSRGAATGGSAIDLIRTGFSSGATSGIFSSAVNKILAAAFLEAPDSTTGWVQEAEVADFKQISAVGQLKTSNLTELPSGGQADHLQIANDLAESTRLRRYAGQFAIDERDLLNDDLGALLRLPVEMGQAAARLRPDAVCAILNSNPTMADGFALFSEQHANLGAGALDASKIEAGVNAIGTQKHGTANLNLNPAFLPCATAQRWDSEIICRSVERFSTDTASSGTRNPLLSLNLEVRADSRLGTSGVINPETGLAVAGSDTSWYLATPSGMTPSVLVCYLSGSGRRPRLRSFSLERGAWGVGFDIEHSIAAVAVGWRGLYKGTGV